MQQTQLLIAEVKTISPFGWKSQHSWDQLFELACKHGDWVSVHTDPRWGGSFELLAEARKRTTKPLLAKGIHASDTLVDKALTSGADYVLVVGRVPKRHVDTCLVEVLTLDQLSLLNSDTQAVWNARDLKTGRDKAEQFEQARTLWNGWLCQASNIRSVKDINPHADAVLVGTYLPEFVRTLPYS